MSATYSAEYKRVGLFAFTVEQETLVHSTPWNIWKVLTDFSAYSSWNPLLPSGQGTLATGQDLHIAMRLTSDTPSMLTCRVVAKEDYKELVWTASYAYPGLLDLVHGFIIAPADKYSSRFTQGLRITGLLSPLYAKVIRQTVIRNMDMMTESLKAHAKARAQR